MRADLYARKSTVDAGRSAARQQREWLNDCASEGLEAGEVFADPDLSASRYARKARPDYANLLAHVRSGRCEMVSIWEASRGSRDLGEWVAFLDLCRAHGVLVRVFSEDQTFDPRKQRDRNALVDMGQDAESETERLSGRVVSGTRDAAAAGRPPGPLLYGYRREYGAPVADSLSPSGARRRQIRQVINEEEAAVVRQLLEDTLAGVPLQTQARALNAAGVATPSGRGRWIGAHINRLMRNPGIVGDRVHRGEVVARDAWPALIPRDKFRAVKALLEAPGRVDRRDPGLKYMCSGGAFCGPCGGPLRLKIRTDFYFCPLCNKVGAARHLMDRDLSKVMVARLQRPDALAALIAEPDEDAAEKARAELGDLREHLDGFYVKAAARQISAEGLAKVEAGIRPQIDHLERRLRELATPPALRDLADIDVAGGWYELPVATQRAIILGLARVVLSPVGKGGRWSLARLGESRWHGDDRTWADHWREGS